MKEMENKQVCGKFLISHQKLRKSGWTSVISMHHGWCKFTGDAEKIIFLWGKKDL